MEQEDCNPSLTPVIVNKYLEDCFQKHLKIKVLLFKSRPEVLSTAITSKTQQWTPSNEVFLATINHPNTRFELIV